MGTTAQPGHKILRHRLYRALDPHPDEGLTIANKVIVALVLMSFITLALETEPDLPAQLRTAINAFNVVVVVVFAVEYVIRLWVAGEDPAYRGLGGRLRYIFSLHPIADLVAFLPELLWMLFAPADASAEFIYFLRASRLARLIKLARYVPAFDILGATLRRSGMQLFTALAMAMALVYISAVALYLIEGQVQEGFASVPRAVWWAIAALTTVGYGDVYPITLLGRLFTVLILLVALGIVAVPTGLIASALTALRQEEREAAKRDG